MSSIRYNDETYWFTKWRIQCLGCSRTLSSGTCACGLHTIKNGQVYGNPLDRKDASLWMSNSGKTLPQEIVDQYFELKIVKIVRRNST